MTTCSLSFPPQINLASLPTPMQPANRRLMYSATGLAVIGTLTISLFAGTLFDLSKQAAEDLRDERVYIDEVAS